MLPHLTVHRRAEITPAARRQRQGAQRHDVVADAVRQLGNQIGCRRQHNEKIGGSRRIKVRVDCFDTVGAGRRRHAGLCFASGDRGKRQRPDELLGCRGHCYGDIGTGLPQTAGNSHGFVGRDPAANAENYFSFVQRRHVNNVLHVCPTCTTCLCSPIVCPIRCFYVGMSSVINMHVDRGITVSLSTPNPCRPLSLPGRHPPPRASAAPIRRAHSSGKARPAAAAAFGIRLVAVKPGMELPSRIIVSSSLTIMSTRNRSRAPRV